jgi:hypothetical protein
MSIVWTDGNTVQQSSASSLNPEHHHSAPPIMQHSMPLAAEEEVVWDDSMMDLEDYQEVQPTTQPDQATETGKQDIQPIQIGGYIQSRPN